MRRLSTMMGVGLAVLALTACNRNGDGAQEPASEAAGPAEPGSAASDQATAPAAPQRKPGLWEQRVSTEGMVQVSRICIDEALEQRLGWWGQQATTEGCEKNLVTRRADGGWQFSSVCDMGSGGKTTTSGVATGDFDTRYVVKAQSSTVGAEAPQMNGTREVNIESAWQGACPEGFRPGDMELPGGIRLNLLDMAGAGS
ncbi:DUF3617 family protein [Phenylobacterium sp.]|uniref:DUF3617 family protein n=1 Tax=Phenylobacterium sp. TaxID=1871053 RepID=UPI002731AF90|nr:DUF3617 family protein [Phenylobacterium sp.]MDP1616118.1 hypothetical protein [Phenylobacterium sp.]MDP1988078.1 hypothetical protein [Phenylobacterium sp.]